MRTRSQVVRAALVAGLAIALGASSAAAKTRDFSPRSEMTGEWKIEPHRDRGRVQLELHDEWSNGSSNGSFSHSFDVSREDLPGIGREDWTAGNAPVRFDLVRDAGTLHLEGTLHHGRGSGEYSFEPNPQFRDELVRAGFRDVEPDEMMRLGIHDIRRDWVRGFRGRDMNLDDLVRFKVHGVTPAFVNTMAAGGYRDLSSDDLVRLKVHGVEPAFVRELGELGYDRPSADDLVRLKVHSVEPSYIRDMLALASPKPSVDDMIRLHVHGVETSYVRDLRGLGYARLTADDLVRLKVHGVSTDVVRRAKSRYGDVSVEDLIRFKSRGEI